MNHPVLIGIGVLCLCFGIIFLWKVFCLEKEKTEQMDFQYDYHDKLIVMRMYHGQMLSMFAVSITFFLIAAATGMLILVAH
jgi:hypothetical protein